jgi:response regulator RpfG family c-di-GMP phosphodiesterase
MIKMSLAIPLVVLNLIGSNLIVGVSMDLFADQRSGRSLEGSELINIDVKSWRVLLVDDDEQIHQITRLALMGFRFQNRPLELLSAYSGREAQQIFAAQDDLALVLIDVVMETEHAGLDLVKFIRDDCGNRTSRLVLRTGQAGQAPEDQVIQEYEIDDYKEKTELTTQKLRTLLYSMLRSYRDLCLIEEQKQGLSRVIEASVNVQNTRTLQNYAKTVLEQLASLLSLDASAFYCLVQPRHNGEVNSALTLAATGEYVSLYRECRFSALPAIVAERCKEVLALQTSQSYIDAYLFYMNDDRGADYLLYVNITNVLSELDKQLLEIYMQNIGLTFEKINLLVDWQETSREIVYNLSNAVEVRSKETGSHVQRVALYCEKLAHLIGLSEYETTMIKNASPLHDIGKVAIPDHILHKPGKLDADEWVEMKRHVNYGVDILSRSKRNLMVTAREIAGTHHEKWDGTGYPNQLQGEAIPISGRISALADVFDALGSKRCYKEPWSHEEIRAEITAQRGRHFDPVLVDLMLAHWDEFIAIREQLPD